MIFGALAQKKAKTLGIIDKNTLLYCNLQKYLSRFVCVISHVTEFFWEGSEKLRMEVIIKSIKGNQSNNFGS